MRTKRIELEGQAGHVAIERESVGSNIRIDSILRDPQLLEGVLAWETWHLEPTASKEDVYKLAQTVQYRCDGVRGTHTMVHDYYRELERFLD